MAKQPTVFIVTQVGTGIRYFFQTDIIPGLLEAGIKVVAVVPNPEELRADLFARLPEVAVEQLRLESLNGSSGGFRSRLEGLSETIVQYLRFSGVSRRASWAAYRDHQRHQDRMLRRGKLRPLVPALRAAGSVMQHSRLARRVYHRYVQSRPRPANHQELFERYQPDLVVTSSPGWWPGDEMLIREAQSRGIPTLAALIGWDHTSTQGLPLALPDRILAWSETQKQELVKGGDVNPEIIEVGGVAHFDNYLRRGVALPREEYFAQRGLDPARRLISFGCTFVAISSNIGMVQILVDAVANNRFGFPAQLLVRLHPTYFKKSAGPYTETSRELVEYERMAREFPYVHLEYPDLNSNVLDMTTSRHDMVNLASLLRHSDVFVTLFSTMALEAAVNDTPVVSVALDPPREWQLERYLSITQVLDWPTHQRIIASGASALAVSPEELIAGVNSCLHDPELHAEERRRFALQECSYLDGQSGKRIASYIAEMASQKQKTLVCRHKEARTA